MYMIKTHQLKQKVIPIAEQNLYVQTQKIPDKYQKLKKYQTNIRTKSSAQSPFQIEI